jgi:EAL domain-containing protein (putative c-di-GMP-specific phosphodiesterase class I)
MISAKDDALSRTGGEWTLAMSATPAHASSATKSVAGEKHGAALDEALSSGWIEFWYQPKIDLRKRQLIGAEADARAIHPQYGMLMPDAFIPGASESSLLKLSELALVSSLEAGVTFAKLGANLRMSVNMPAGALLTLPVGDIVKSYRPKFEKWPGLIIDVAAEQILPDLALAAEFTKMHEELNIKLALDDFGRGHSSLSQLDALPFAELKLARAVVADCGTDKVNAPLCKTVIDLAHNFGSMAVAIGIEKASDALALIGMGCDYGQGFLLGRPMPEERFIALLRQRATPPARPVPAARVMEKRLA